MTNFLRGVAESVGFLHSYGGYESDSRMVMDSRDSKGNTWSSSERHLVKTALVVGLGGIAYEANQIAEVFGLV